MSTLPPTKNASLLSRTLRMLREARWSMTAAQGTDENPTGSFIMRLLNGACKPFAGTRVAFANEAAMANSLVGDAGFEVVDGGHLFVPYGNYPHKQGEQRFDRAAADQLVANFKKPWARFKRLANVGTPVYVGHPDVPGQGHLYPDSRAYAWIESLQAEANGLRIVPKWSKPGAEMIANAHYRYHSVYWDAVPDGRGGWKPVYLLSVGLTNTPNIPVPALANEADTTPENQPDNTTTTMDPELLKLLGLAETADKAAVLQAVTTIKNELASLKDAKTGADKAKADAEAAKSQLDATKTAIENAVTSARSARIELALDRLIGEGRVLPAERAGESSRLLALANDATIGTELETLGKVDPKLKTKSQTTGAAAQRAEALKPKTDPTRAQAVANAVQVERDALERLYPGNPNNHSLSFANARRKHPEVFQPQTA